MEEDNLQSGIFTGTLEDFLKTRKPGDEALQSPDKNTNPKENWWDCCEYRCEICNETLWSNLRFHWHITKKHGIKSTKDYRLLYGNPDILPRYHECQLCERKMVWEGTRIRDHLKRHAHPEKPTLEQYGEMFKEYIQEKIAVLKVKIDEMPEELRAELESYAKSRAIPTLSIRKSAQEELHQELLVEPSDSCELSFVSVKSEMEDQEIGNSKQSKTQANDYTTTWYDCCQFQCGLCQEIFWSLKEFRTHIMSEHDIKTVEEYRAILGDPEISHKTHQCQQCHTMVKWEESSLREHMNSHVLHRQTLEEYGLLYKNLILPKVSEIKDMKNDERPVKGCPVKIVEKEPEPAISQIKEEALEQQQYDKIDIKQEAFPMESSTDNITVKCEIDENTCTDSFLTNSTKIAGTKEQPNSSDTTMDDDALNKLLESCTSESLGLGLTQPNTLQTSSADDINHTLITQAQGYNPKMTISTPSLPSSGILTTVGGVQPTQPNTNQMSHPDLFSTHFLSFPDENQLRRQEEQDTRNMPGGVFNSAETMEYVVDESEFVIKGANYECQQCGYTISSKRRYMMKNHILAEHKGVRYKCNDCNYEGKSREKLNAHIKRVHYGISSSAGPGVVNDGTGLKCDKCDFKTNRGMYELNLHIQAEHEGIKHFCLKCSFSSKRKDLVQRHMKQKHLGVVFKCEHCTYTSSWKYSLQRHSAKCQGANNGVQKIEEKKMEEEEEERIGYGNFIFNQDVNQSKSNSFLDQIKMEPLETIDPCQFVVTNFDSHLF